MFFEPGNFGSAHNAGAALVPPWSPSDVRWSEGKCFFVLRTVHEGESSRWCLGASAPLEILLPHEKTFVRIVREKYQVMHKEGMNPWPLFAAVDVDWKAWTQWLESCVEGRTPLMDTNYVTLWDPDKLKDAALFGLVFKNAMVLDGHHSLEAQKSLRRQRALGWFVPLEHPELRVRSERSPGITKSEIWGRAVQKRLFPQKATYFFPKIPFGLMAEKLS